MSERSDIIAMIRETTGINLFEEQARLEAIARKVSKEKWAQHLAEADEDERRMREEEAQAHAAHSHDELR